MDRRSLLLNEMGISLWRLNRPNVLQGAVGISIDKNIRFVIVTEDDILHSALLSDILRSLEMPKEACLCLSFDQIQHIECQHTLSYWVLANLDSQFESISAFCVNADYIYRTTNWGDFSQNPAMKRKLWKQIQQTEK